MRRAKSDAGPQLRAASSGGSGNPPFTGTPRAEDGGASGAGTGTGAPRLAGLRGTLGVLSSPVRGTLGTLTTRSPQRAPLRSRSTGSPGSFRSSSSRSLGLRPAGGDAPTSPTAAFAAGLGAFLGHYTKQDRVVLTSRAGDLSTAHLLADRERHFLEDELRVGCWIWIRFCCLHGCSSRGGLSWGACKRKPELSGLLASSVLPSSAGKQPAPQLQRSTPAAFSPRD